MATKIFFGNNQIMLPGAYATIKALIDTPPIVSNYGRVLVIDTGRGAGFGGGSGISGDLANNADSVYRFSRLADYRDFLKGSDFWKAAEALFKPMENLPGASEVLHVRAAKTTKGTGTFQPTGGANNGGTFKFNPKDEGIIANGLLETGNLYKGYAYSVETGIKDTDKWIMKIWRGTWTGEAADGESYDELSKVEVQPILVAQSPEFDNMATLIEWGKSREFNNRFVLSEDSTVTGTGEIVIGDIVGLNDFNLVVGGTETYSDTYLEQVLNTIQDVDYAILLCDRSGDDYEDAEVGKMFLHIKDDAKFMKFMLVGGGNNEDEFSGADGSLEIAEYFDSAQVIVVHGGVKKSSYISKGILREWDSFFHAAYIAGRLAGLEPQVPITNKSLNIDGVVHQMTKYEKELALEAGVLCTNYNEYTGTFNVVQGVNSIQKNTALINPDATSFSIQIMRIVSQINRDLVINANVELLADEDGVNMNTLSKGTLENWTKNHLQGKVASPERDNLLLSYKNVTITQQEDSYLVNFEITVNGEITKVFFTGFIVQ